MKKVKIIDLFKKAANGEEMPKRIIYNNKVFEWYNWTEDYVDYVYSGSEGLLNGSDYDIFSILNDEVEIIEKESTFNDVKVEIIKKESTYNDIREQVGLKKIDPLDPLSAFKPY